MGNMLQGEANVFVRITVWITAGKFRFGYAFASFPCCNPKNQLKTTFNE